MALEDVPAKLKLYNNWVIWRLETLENGRVTKVPYSPHTGRLASSVDPNTWSSWFQANAALAASGFNGLGFVFGPNDPFCGIDLDDPYAVDPTTGQPKYSGENLTRVLGLQKAVYDSCNATYAEFSPSGKGLHIIGEAVVPQGRRRDAIELYSTGRFFTVTGNVHRAFDVTPMQPQVDWLYDQLGGKYVEPAFTGTYVDAEEDQTILARAYNAENGPKFADLWEGRWEGLYTSQSEADFALVDILAFYTPSIPQIKRMFRMSALGQRDKAQREDYVNYMVKKSFDRHPAPLDTDAMRASIEAKFFGTGVPFAPAEPQTPDDVVPPPTTGPNPYLAAVPGLVGQIAHFIYEASPRPVAEVALATSLGLLAGICGRGWNISGAGLNLYIMLLAGTGRGKEAMHNGISKLMAAVADPLTGGCPGALEFLGPEDIASGQALVKYLNKTSKSFVSVQGEFDLTLKSFTQKNANAALIKLKQIILKSYSRSGRNGVLQPTIYSEAEKNTQAIARPAFTLIGEGTPRRFYNLLDEALVQDGLLPRFTVVHYDGDRVPLNKAAVNVVPPVALVKSVAALCGQALMLNQSQQIVDVAMTADAEALADAYDRECDRLINSAQSDTYEQLWNRAHLKVLKIAAIVAVGISPVAPVVTREAVQYAIDIVNFDTKRLMAKFESGDVGDSESRQVNIVRKLLRLYVTSSPNDAEKLSATPQMVHDKVVTKRFLQGRTSNLAPFKNDRLGATNALNRVLLSLIEAGVMAQVGGMDTRKYTTQNAKLYVVTDASWLAVRDGESDD